MPAGISFQQLDIIPPVPTTNQLVATHYKCCSLECRLHRTKRTVVVNTERNTPAVWGDVRVTTRGHRVKKEQSNHRPLYTYQ